ncbi:MAG: helix-turn-helix transcriptional regulator [Proteobacteria bacterium]|nr:helix-turn-helix transcriptional regulator [Pseudomonadota bacterium]
MEALLGLLAGPWTTYILWVLATSGTLRFGALRRAVPGISARLLALRLRRLEDAGVVARTVEPAAPPRVSYALTARGFELAAALEALNVVARRWYPDQAEGPPARIAAPEAGDQMASQL